ERKEAEGKEGEASGSNAPGGSAGKRTGRADKTKKRTPERWWCFVESRMTNDESPTTNHGSIKRTTDMACFELIEKMAPNAVIKVIGVGGGGGNAVAHMVNSSVDGVEFVIANTDSQAIKNCGAKLQLQLGGNVTKGLGAGANPEVG